MFFAKTRTKLYIYKLIDERVNAHYKVRIMAGFGMDADQDSDTQAKGAVAELVVSGEMDRADVDSICESYMNLRSSFIEANGGIAEWMEK